MGDKQQAENQVNDVQDTLDDTLLEIHKLISDIENPFTLVGKLVNTLGKDKTMELLTGEKKSQAKPNAPSNANQAPQVVAPVPGVQVPTVAAQQPLSGVQTTTPVNSPQASTISPITDREAATANQTDSALASYSRISLPLRALSSPNAQKVTEYKETIVSKFGGSNDSLDGDRNQPNMDIIRYVNSLALANFLANLFGKEGSIEVLGSYVKRNWVKEEIARTLLDATTLLGKNDFNAIHRGLKEASADDHRIALYLLEEFGQSLFSYQLSVRFQDLLFLMQAVLGVSSKNNTGNGFSDQGDLR